MDLQFCLCSSFCKRQQKFRTSELENWKVPARPSWGFYAIVFLLSNIILKEMQTHYLCFMRYEDKYFCFPFASSSHVTRLELSFGWCKHFSHEQTHWLALIYLLTFCNSQPISSKQHQPISLLIKITLS